MLWAVESLLGSASLTLVPQEAPQAAFAGAVQTVEVRFCNSTPSNLEVPLRYRVFQASSATALPLDEPHRWKTLPVLAGQTVLDSLTVTFPAVRAETRFLLQWFDERGHALGTTEVIAVSPDLLRELNTLAGNPPPGVLDPQEQLKPLLRRAGVEFEDLDLEGLERYRGRLAIVCSARAVEDDSPALGRRLKHCREIGVNLLWFRDADPASSQPAPVCMVRPGAGTLVVAPRQALSDLAESATRQRTLISLARLAVKPESSALFQP